MTLHIDFETRSTIDLRKTGVYAYAAHDSTEVWCAAYAFGDDPVQLWQMGDPCPSEIYEHVLVGGVLTAHNAAFERIIWRYVLAGRYDWPEPATEQWRCTMVMAYAMALPGSLEDAAPAVGLDMRKDMAGRRLMLQLAKPRKITADGEVVWWDDTDKLSRLFDYCKQDVEVERALEKRLRPLSKSELALWHLDQRINDRGVLVDETLCDTAKVIVRKAQKDLDQRMQEVTDKDVTACSNRNQIVKFVRDHGVECDSINKAAMEELLDEGRDIPPVVRQVLELRREAAKASVSKIDALLNGMSPEDKRAKGLLQFHSASTGRWGGRRFQPQNLVRPEHGDSVIELLIDTILAGDTDMLDMLDIPYLTAVAQTLRGMVVAAPGHRIVAADYSNIEGRVLAWLAGEEWKLNAFRDFDSGEGDDLYKITAAGILGKQPGEITKDERQSHGKVPELALGYQGGVGAFKTMGANYGVDLPDGQIIEIRDGWREKHPNIKALWYAMEEAAVEAVTNKGSTTHAGKIRFKQAGSFLFMQLPSKRFLCYSYPELRPSLMPWLDRDGAPVWKEQLTYFTTIDVAKRSKIVDDKKNGATWARIKTYGGMLTENATQAVARDVLADAMVRLEAHGYPIILTVHDEIVAEVANCFGTVGDMEDHMNELPDWAAGLPVATEGFEGERYRK